jgi:hypothetical protein
LGPNVHVSGEQIKNRRTLRIGSWIIQNPGKGFPVQRVVFFRRSPLISSQFD